jgi:pyrophosphatase PpaX
LEGALSGSKGDPAPARPVARIDVVGYPVVLFDLDGTLVDSGAIILASFKHATQTVLQREFPDEHILAAVGGSNLDEQMRRLDPDRVDELVTVYRAHNEPLQAELLACAGVPDVLDELRAEGRRLGVVTAKRQQTIALAFEAVPALGAFDVVVGSDDTERHKPDPEPILHALELLGARAEDAAYVGDSPFDIRAGKAAGVFTVAVAWGNIHPRERVEAEAPDAFVDTAEELLGCL